MMEKQFVSYLFIQVVKIDKKMKEELNGMAKEGKTMHE